MGEEKNVIVIEVIERVLLDQTECNKVVSITVECVRVISSNDATAKVVCANC